MKLRRVTGICVVVVLAAMAAVGCSTLVRKAASADSTADVSPASLSFRYVGESGEDNTMNQILEIENDHQGSVVPVLAITPVDSNGRSLPDVTVSTVYGSDQGSLVVPYGTGIDILRFSGPSKNDVADVQVKVRDVTVARTPAGRHDVEAQALDAQGREVTKFERFSAVRLTNRDDSVALVRIVYIVWDQPPAGVTQQAVEVTSIGGLTEVPARGTAVVQVTGEAAASVERNAEGPAVSLKAFPSQ